MITPSYSATATERVLPKLALDFTTAVMDARVSVSRALNTATRVNSSGYIESINANLPRFDYDPATLICKGLLIEESRSNLLLQSENFSTTWVRNNILAFGGGSVVNATNGPDNTLSADLVVEAATTSAHFMSQSTTTVSGANYAMSVFAKPAGRNWVCLEGGSGGGAFSVWFDVANGVVGTIIGTTAANVKIEPYKNEFYRCIVIDTTTGTAPNYRVYICSADNVQSYAGDGVSGVYIWGAQLEAGAFATSYIPTTTTSLTRNADQVSMTGTNFSDWYNASEGTFYVQGIPTTTASSGALSIDDGTSSQRMQVRALSNGAQAAVVDGGATQANITTGTWAANAKGQCVFAYKVNNFACAAGGAAAGTDAAGTVPTVNNLKIGGSAGLNQAYFNGAISKVFYWPQRCINAEVQAFSKG